MQNIRRNNLFYLISHTQLRHISFLWFTVGTHTFHCTQFLTQNLVSFNLTTLTSCWKAFKLMETICIIFVLSNFPWVVSDIILLLYPFHFPVIWLEFILLLLTKMFTFRLLVTSMQSKCLEGLGGEKGVDAISQETTLIQQIFGGRLMSKVFVELCTVACTFHVEKYFFMQDHWFFGLLDLFWVLLVGCSLMCQHRSPMNDSVCLSVGHYLCALA